MKEKENTEVSTSRKKKLIYSIVIAVCALLLITATILTIYFVMNGNREIVEKPPIDNQDDQIKDDNEPSGQNPDQNPSEQNPDESQTGGQQGENPGEPTGGEKVAFVKPLEFMSCSVEYNQIYNNTSTDKWYRHMAMDFAAEEGTEVKAMGDGKVLKISLEEVLGNYVVLEHEGGITTLYRFIAPVSNLKEGDEVKQGQVIGTVDKAFGTEYKDGTHLHLEMKLDGNNVDPKDYIDVTLEEK